MKNKLIYLIVILMTILSCDNVYAASDVNHGYNQSYINDCVEKNTCMLLCAYTNKVRYTSNNIEPKYNYYSSYIYYNFKDKNYYVEWLSQETDIKYALNSGNLNNDKVYLYNNGINLTLYGECPKESFIDINGIASEVCFADNTFFCTEDSKNSGTRFKGESVLEYDYQTHIKDYYEKWFLSIEDVSCTELKNQDVDLESKYVEDFSDNFLYGNPIPNFISDSTLYKSELENIDKKIDSLLEKCNQEDKEKYDNGDITQEEYNDSVNKNEAGAADLKEQMESATNKINLGSLDLNLNPDLDFNVSDSCNSYLGSTKFNENNEVQDPAYYLQIAFNIIKYIAIIMLIVLTIMEFLKAIVSNNQDATKKALQNTLKRIIIAFIIFFLPILIEFLFKLLGIYSPDMCVLK